MTKLSIVYLHIIDFFETIQHNLQLTKMRAATAVAVLVVEQVPNSSSRRKSRRTELTINFMSVGSFTIIGDNALAIRTPNGFARKL